MRTGVRESGRGSTSLSLSFLEPLESSRVSRHELRHTVDIQLSPSVLGEPSRGSAWGWRCISEVVALDVQAWGTSEHSPGVWSSSVPLKAPLL